MKKYNGWHGDWMAIIPMLQPVLIYIVDRLPTRDVSTYHEFRQFKYVDVHHNLERIRKYMFNQTSILYVIYI